MTPFTWRNCYADVQASKHDITIESYLNDVILPSLAMLETKIDALGASNEPGHEFAQADMIDVLKETKMSFALSVQAIWERQLRVYLLGCALELRPGDPSASRAQVADWKGLCRLFYDLRGINLEAFPSFDALDTLQLMGNACRHGDGKSAAELSRRCPDLWRPVPPLPPEFGITSPMVPAVDLMEIAIGRLTGFVEAIATFWRDAEYIHNESIERKHPGLEEWLARERANRAWMPVAGRERG